MSIDMSKPLPEVQPWTEDFWKSTRSGQLLVQTCKECQTRIFPPRKRCPECWSDQLGSLVASGRGRVFTFSTAYSMVEPRFADELPYTIAYVDLDEGVRMMTRLDCDPSEVAIGMEVEVVFHERGAFSLPYFRPVRKVGHDD